jgi:hypothetical protein
MDSSAQSQEERQFKPMVDSQDEPDQCSGCQFPLSQDKDPDDRPLAPCEKEALWQAIMTNAAGAVIFGQK